MDEGGRGPRDLQPHVSLIHLKTLGKQLCYIGSKMKIDTRTGVLSENKRLCLWSSWGCFMPRYPPLPIQWPLFSISGNDSLPAFLWLWCRQVRRALDGASILWDFLSPLPLLISVHPQNWDAAGLSEHYLWIRLEIDLQFDFPPPLFCVYQRKEGLCPVHSSVFRGKRIEGRVKR